MAKRKRGGQPGNKNAKGHRGRNRWSPGAKPMNPRALAQRQRSRAARTRARLGVRLRGTVRGYRQYAARRVRQFVKTRRR